MSKNVFLTLNAAEKHTQFLFSDMDTKHILHSQMSLQTKASTEFLIPAIANVCQKYGISINNIQGIAAVIGPGNFMGIRLTAVTTSALIRLANKNTLQAPLNYMQCLALNVAILEKNFPQFLQPKEQSMHNNQEAIYSDKQNFQNFSQSLNNKTVRVLTTATKSSVHICDFTFDVSSFPHPLFATKIYELPENDSESAMKNTCETKEGSTQNQEAYLDTPLNNSPNISPNISFNNSLGTPFDNDFEQSTKAPDFLIGSGLIAHLPYFQKKYPHALLLTQEFLQTIVSLIENDTDSRANSANNVSDNNASTSATRNVNNSSFYEIPLPNFAHTPSMKALHTLTLHETTKWQKEDIAPLYLKECDALQNLDSIAKSQGRDPKSAHTELDNLMNSSII